MDRVLLLVLLLLLLLMLLLMMKYAAGDEKQSIDKSMNTIKRLLYTLLLNKTITTLTVSILDSADGAIDGVNED